MEKWSMAFAHFKLFCKAEVKNGLLFGVNLGEWDN